MSNTQVETFELIRNGHSNTWFFNQYQFLKLYFPSVLIKENPWIFSSSPVVPMTITKFPGRRGRTETFQIDMIVNREPGIITGSINKQGQLISMYSYNFGNLSGEIFFNHEGIIEYLSQVRRDANHNEVLVIYFKEGYLYLVFNWTNGSERLIKQVLPLQIRIDNISHFHQLPERIEYYHDLMKDEYFLRGINYNGRVEMRRGRLSIPTFYEKYHPIPFYQDEYGASFTYQFDSLIYRDEYGGAEEYVKLSNGEEPINFTFLSKIQPVEESILIQGIEFSPPVPPAFADKPIYQIVEWKFFREGNNGKKLWATNEYKNGLLYSV